MLFVDEVFLQGKKVLVRVDFNVPITNSEIQDDSRIRASIPTLKYILDQGGKLVLCSHRGKPKGKFHQDLSLKPVAHRLQELLKQEVSMATDCIGEEVKHMVEDLQPGEVLLLENLRFHPGETDNEPDFSKQLAELAEVYVNDAFGVVHRSHASVQGITKYMQTVTAGFLIKKEMQYLHKALSSPEHPYVLISGGAKVSSKLGILNNLMDRVDRIIVGGGMANTFRRAQGHKVGLSKTEDDLIEDAQKIMDKAKKNNISFYLPVDYVTASDLQASQPSGIFPYQNVADKDMILDTGPASHTLFSEVLKEAKTVVWNGPMGVFENPTFSQGSVGMTQTVANLQATTIVGGGDTDSLVHNCGVVDQIDFISTGGGSFLEFLEGKELPGLKALE